MKKEEIRAQVNAEVETFRKGLSTLLVAEVHAIHQSEIEKYGAGADAFKGLRTEVNAALQLKNPPPHTHDPKDAVGRLTPEARDALHDASRQGVSDVHRILSDHARQLDPNHSDAHHFVQKLQGMALWKETDRLIAEAGIVGGGS